MIYETIITSVNMQGQVHVAPFGVQYLGDKVKLSPFRPSTTLENILTTEHAVLNIVNDVRVFAGALTGRQAWQFVATSHEHQVRLSSALSHTLLILDEVHDDKVRPQLMMKKLNEQSHRLFQGFNRAQAAVIELAVLTSRLHILPREKIINEIEYLQIAIDKTASEVEQEAWGWLLEKINHFFVQQDGINLS